MTSSAYAGVQFQKTEVAGGWHQCLKKLHYQQLQQILDKYCYISLSSFGFLILFTLNLLVIHSCGPNFFYRTNSPTAFSLLARNNSNPASPLTAFSGCFSRHDGLHIQEYLSCAVTNSINSPVFIFSTKAIPRRIPLTNTTVTLFPSRMTAHQVSSTITVWV